ncbi:MAG: hypothetical protein KDA61_10745 [Planctomycetales bacterium]|nr:hypothetical protein [Planctomycetales bacterium]
MVQRGGISPNLPALFLAFCAGIVAANSSRPVCNAQVRVQFNAGANASSNEQRAELHTDRTLSRGLKIAQQQIADGEYTLALQFLDDVLGRDDDFFLEAEGSQWTGLKETAANMLRDLSDDGRAVYESSFGTVAKRLLSEAIESGDPTAVQRIAIRYYYTTAGMEAALLHAINEADAGRRVSAALMYGRLLATPEAAARFNPELALRAASCWLAAGNRDEADAALATLRSARLPDRAQVEIAGEPHRIDPNQVDADWLEKVLGGARAPLQRTLYDWLTYRGNVERTSTATGGLPHMRERWRVRLLHPRLTEVFDGLNREMRLSGSFSPVASSALAVGDVVLVRTPHQLLAVSFTTGKRIWQAELEDDPDLEELLDQASSEARETRGAQALGSFARRMWRDYLYHLLSSDGRRVYVVSSTSVDPSLDIWNNIQPRFQRGIATTTANRLTALDLPTEGKRVWSIDGPTAEGPLAGAFFLGAPTCVGSSLYALVEIRSAVHLAVLESTTGELQWLQQLAMLDANASFEPSRRLQSTMPSYASGILVCPTSAGVVIGVDVARRSLAWAYRYPVRAANYPYGSRDEDLESLAPQQWLSDSPTIVGERVLLTPHDSEELHCIDLRTGQAVWRQPRGEMRQLACADSKRLLLMGAKSLYAMR